MKKTDTITVRDLLPIKAVQCHLSGKLVPFFRSCKGEGTRKGEPCEFYVPTYMCRYLRNLGVGVDSHEIKPFQGMGNARPLKRPLFLNEADSGHGSLPTSEKPSFPKRRRFRGRDCPDL